MAAGAPGGIVGQEDQVLFQQYLEFIQANLGLRDPVYQALFTGKHDGRVYWEIDQRSSMGVSITNPSPDLRLRRIVVYHVERPQVDQADDTAYLQAPEEADCDKKGKF